MNNFLRWVEHRFEPVTVDAIQVEVQKTNGDEPVRITEVRVYMEGRLPIR